jgi:hypothetical protein
MAYKRLVLNRIRTPDGTVLTSHYRHDYKAHIDKNGFEYIVDGGSYYAKRSVNVPEYEELSVYENEPFEVIRQSLLWGTCGKEGNTPLHYIRLCDMEDEHLLNCVNLVPDMDDMYYKFFWQEIEYRKRRR